MRLVTILASLLLGMALCVLFLYNQTPVEVHFVKVAGGQLTHASVNWPVWKIVTGADLIGAAFGYLIGMSSTPSRPRMQDRPPADEPKPVQEVDYLLAVPPRQNH